MYETKDRLGLIVTRLLYISTRDHRSVGHKVPSEWATLPLELRGAQSLAAFKRTSRAGFVRDYGLYECGVRNCYVCGGYVWLASRRGAPGGCGAALEVSGTSCKIIVASTRFFTLKLLYKWFLPVLNDMLCYEQVHTWASSSVLSSTDPMQMK